MALSPEEISFEHASPLTAPVPDFSAGGLPECPSVTEAELRVHADELVARWKPLAAAAIDDNLIKRRTELRERLGERLACVAGSRLRINLHRNLNCLKAQRCSSSRYLPRKMLRRGFTSCPGLSNVR